MTTADSGAPATGTTDEQTETPPAAPEKDWQAEYAKLLDQSRKWEGRAKANSEAAKELEALKAQSMTDTERAVAEASAKARAEALAEVAAERVSDSIRAAAAGRPVDVDALLEGVNASRFVNDEGQVDRDAIGAWIDKVAPAKAEVTPPPFPPLMQGVRSAVDSSTESLFAQALENAGL